MLEKLLNFGRRIIPKPLFRVGQPFYHFLLAVAGALIYRFPARELKVVAVTGTKGKSTTVELISTILDEAGIKHAALSTISFKVGDTTERNLYKMTMPGRFFVQRFLRQAVVAGCQWAVIEMTSEGVKQFRHLFTPLDALVFTNLSPEHIESHGSFEKYRDAKRKIGKALERSHKKNRVIIANADDKEGAWYLGLDVSRSVPLSLAQAEPFEPIRPSSGQEIPQHNSGQTGGFQLTFRNTLIRTHLPGTFNLYNTLAAALFADSQNIPVETIKHALENFTAVRGRVEYVQKEPFAVVVDYAHTPDSLKQFYGVFEGGHNICILGNTGGGRDTWKRPEMAHIAEKHCEHVILTNEDPYDEDPRKIVEEMAEGVDNKDKLAIIMDRREAIAEALKTATLRLVRQAHSRQAQGASDKNINVLITGKGTDPYIMEKGGTKTPWDDATVVREELKKLGLRG